MRRSPFVVASLAVVLVVPVACGGKVDGTERIEPTAVAHPSPPGSPTSSPSAPSPVHTAGDRPEPAPTGPTATPSQDLLPAPKDSPAPLLPSSPPAPPTATPSPPDIGATLPPTVVACTIGESVEMSFRIPAEEMANGASDKGGAGYCTGVVKFQAEPFDGSYWDTSSTPWKRVAAVANGRSYNPKPQSIPSHVHTSTLVYADGRREEQYCTFWAMCENGTAKGVWFTW